MSQHSAASTATTTSATTTNSVAGSEEESHAKPSSSFLFGSLKKQKNKDTEVFLTDDFVLMATPEKFKDKNVNESNVVKRHRFDSSPHEKVNLECLLLSDTTVSCGAPVHVQALFEHYVDTHLTQGEILFLLVYTVALESGYAAQSDYEQTKFSLDTLTATSSFHAKNTLRLTHLKPQYTVAAEKTRFTLKLHTLVDVAEHHEGSADLLYSLLTGFVTGDFLIITLTPANSTSGKGFSTALSIGRYVLSMQAKNKPIQQRFRKLDELTCVLRDQLLVPMRCQQLIWLECWIYPSLDGMPVELYDHVLKYLNKNELKILANVNKSLYNLIKSCKFMLKSQ